MCRSTSLGDVFTSVLHPATASHRDLTPGRRQELGIVDGLVRISVGIEKIDDIIADIEQALSRINDYNFRKLTCMRFASTACAIIRTNAVGLLLGRYRRDGKSLDETYPISNAREESAKRNRFLIEPEELMRGERYAREQRSRSGWFLSFASGFAGRAVAIRSRACVAHLLVHHCFDE